MLIIKRNHTENYNSLPRKYSKIPTLTFPHFFISNLQLPPKSSVSLHTTLPTFPKGPNHSYRTAVIHSKDKNKHLFVDISKLFPKWPSPSLTRPATPPWPLCTRLPERKSSSSPCFSSSLLPVSSARLNSLVRPIPWVSKSPSYC